MDELNQLEAELSKAIHAKNKFLTIIESLPNPVILADARNRFEYMNQPAARLFERTPSCGANFYYEAEDSAGSSPKDTKTGSVESCLPWLDKELAAFTAGPDITRSFEKAFKADGVGRNYAVRFSRMQDISSKFLGTVIILEDITEKKLAEDALRLSEERFRSIFESATDSIVVWDKDCNYLYANQAAIDHIGTTRDKVIGKSIGDGLGHLPDIMKLWINRVGRVFKTGEPMRVEDAVEIGSKFIYSESVLSPIKDYRGNMFAVGVLYRDVTERKKMENQLRRQNVALEQSNEGLERANRQIIEQQKSIIEEERLKVLLQMAGATAHELNQPLMALLGYIEMIALDRNDPEKVGKYSEQIEDAGRRIADIVRKFQTIRHEDVKPSAGESAELNLDKPITILSIEDNELDFRKIKATFDHLRLVRIEHADDIGVAFEMLLDNSYDLIFVDYALPSGNALDFMAMLAEERVDIPVVVITGKGDEMIASKVIQYGAYDYLPKSRISKKSLARIIRNTMDKFRMKSEVRLAMEKMAELSTKDELTDLHNRRYFMEFAEREVSGTARYGHSLSLLMLDIDHFKLINDSYGHLAGDTVLRHTAGLLKDSIRKFDVACRYGGEEFAVIMPNTNLNDARTFCERLRQEVARTTVSYEARKISYTVSIGLAQYNPETDKSITHLIKRADKGLYAAKEQGRNRVVAREDRPFKVAG